MNKAYNPLPHQSFRLKYLVLNVTNQLFGEEFLIISAIVMGAVSKADAKITGTTPAEFIFNGK
jgi:hypothetical protein